MLRTLKQAHRIGFTVQIPYMLPLKTMVYIWKYAETAPITSHACPLLQTQNFNTSKNWQVIKQLMATKALEWDAFLVTYHQLTTVTKWGPWNVFAILAPLSSKFCCAGFDSVSDVRISQNTDLMPRHQFPRNQLPYDQLSQDKLPQDQLLFIEVECTITKYET